MVANLAFVWQIEVYLAKEIAAILVSVRTIFDECGDREILLMIMKPCLRAFDGEFPIVWYG